MNVEITKEQELRHGVTVKYTYECRANNGTLKIYVSRKVTAPGPGTEYFGRTSVDPVDVPPDVREKIVEKVVEEFESVKESHKIIQEKLGGY